MKSKELETKKSSLLELPPHALPFPENERYRQKQLAGWIFERGAEDFAAMTTLPGRWREALGAAYDLSPFVKTERFPSKDGSVRYLFTLSDGRATEAVYMPYQGRKTVCISSMVGCPRRVRVLRHGRARLRAELEPRGDSGADSGGGAGRGAGTQRGP